MGFKSLSQRNNTQYKVDGLIFPSKERYQDLKGIDIGVDIILSDFDNKEELQAFFDKIKPIEVIETYPDASEETDGLFPNITQLLCLEGNERFYLDYKFACMFFSKKEIFLVCQVVLMEKKLFYGWQKVLIQLLQKLT